MNIDMTIRDQAGVTFNISIFLFIILISFIRSMVVIMKQQKSVTGQEIHTPKRLKKIGSINNAGMKNNKSLHNVIIRAGLALPIAWKKVLPSMGKLHKGASIAISLKGPTPFSIMFISLVKIRNSDSGKITITTNPIVAIIEVQINASPKTFLTLG